MDQKVQPTRTQPRNIVEIVVHVSEELNESQRDGLVAALSNAKGITGAEFCPLRTHLMLVRYERESASSQSVLASITAQKYKAQLIGPI